MSNDRVSLILDNLDNPGLRGWLNKKLHITDERKLVFREYIERNLPSAETVIDDIRETKPHNFEVDLTGDRVVWVTSQEYNNSDPVQFTGDWQFALTQAWLFVMFGLDTRKNNEVDND